MPLWPFCVRMWTHRWAIRRPAQSHFLQQQWRTPYPQLSYSTALPATRHDDHGLSETALSEDSVDDASILLRSLGFASASTQQHGLSNASTVASVTTESSGVAHSQHRSKRVAREQDHADKGYSPSGEPFTLPVQPVPRRKRNLVRSADQPRSPSRGTNDVWTTKYSEMWKKRLRTISVNYNGVSETHWRPWVPTIDVRAAEWSEHILSLLESGREIIRNEDLELYAEPHDVWIEVALWLMTYEPRSMPDFLLATHDEVYKPSFFAEDSLLFLANLWHHSQESDRVLQLRRLSDVLAVLADRTDETRLTFYNGFFRILIRHCPDEQVMKIYETIQMHSIGVHWYTFLHFCTKFANGNYFKHAHEALIRARDAGADLNSYAFRSNCATLLRKSSTEPDGLRECLRIVSDLVDIGVKLNNPICDIIMLNAVEAGDLRTAFDVYHSLVQRGLQPTESTFAVLLKGCKMNIDDAESLNTIIRDAIGNVAVRKSPAIATEIIHCLALHHSRHNPSSALHTLTEAYAQLFDLRPLQTLGLPVPAIQQNHDDFMQPTRHAVNFMLEASITHNLANLPYAQGILPVYDRWREQVEAGDSILAQLATNDYTSNIFLKAFIQHPSGLIHAARVVRDMQQPLPSTSTPDSGIKQCAPTVQTYTIFLQGFTRHNKMKLAEQILTYMRSKGIEPNLVTWNTLMTGYAKQQDEDGVLDAVRRAEEGGREVWDRWTFGGVKWLRNQRRLMEVLERGRVARKLDFGEELRAGLEQRLGGVDVQASGHGAVAETSVERREVNEEAESVPLEHAKEDESVLVDSPSEIAERSAKYYRPF